VDLRPGVVDRYPNKMYSMSTPGVIYKNLIITGAQLQEEPTKGPAGEIRAWTCGRGN
jgi:quinoprotein glucose dehydrogenase